MQELRQQYPLAALLRMADLARSTFYFQLKAQATEDKHGPVKEQIRTIFHNHHGRYGYRRVCATLRQSGIRINHKTVQRLMGELELHSLVRPKRYRSYRGEAGRTAPNVLNRDFNAHRPNEKWLTDVTEFNLGGEKIYLSPVLDVFNGEIIAYETGTRPTFDLVSSMMSKAFTSLGHSDRPILHSDQGWQYQMGPFQKMLSEHQVTPSMSRKGNCHDNAMMESFFAVLKTEFFYLNKFAGNEDLKQGLDDYIHYYNHNRIKMKLGGLSPVAYRAQFARIHEQAVQQ